MRFAGWLVPTAAREEWQREWHAELWHRHHALEARGSRSRRDRAAFAVRSIGAIFDALQHRLGDVQSWRESFSTVAEHWGRRSPSVASGILLLSLGITADAMLIAASRTMLGAPHSEWSGLGRDARMQVLGIAICCGASLIVASAAVASRLLGTPDPSTREAGRGSIRVAETLLVAGITAWVGRSLTVVGMYVVPPPGWVPSESLGAIVTSAWIVSWISGLSVLVALRAHRRTRGTVLASFSDS
ncbi:MAG: hypothetical protein ABIP93_03980 [Gemmatimonadaceae bacterium]